MMCVEKERVFRGRDYALYLPLTLVNLAAMGWFLFYWVSTGHRSFVTVSFTSVTVWIMTALILYNFSIASFRWFMLPLMSRPKPMTWRTPWRVGVATTFVPGLESLAMLEKTVQALVRMHGAHDTWVLDEGDLPEVRAMCARLGALHFSRKERPEYQQPSGTFEKKTKHGNYNAWLDAEGYRRYDVIVGFDPDHVPDVAFLQASLGYLEDPVVGYVQLPQAYYNQRASFIARGAAEETYSYYSSTQMSSYSFGFPVVTGCHHVHRTTALQQIGGFAAHDADDLLITLLYRAAGWQGVYVPEIHARGLTPTDWPAYLGQQQRWSRSVIDIKLRAFPKVAGRMPLWTRVMSFLHGFYYVQAGVAGFAGVALLLYMLGTGTVPEFLSLDVIKQFVITSLILTLTGFFRQTFFLDPRREWGLHFRAGFLRLVKWPYMFFGLIDGLTGRKHPYSITIKARRSGKRPFMTWPHLLVFVLVGGALLVAQARPGSLPGLLLFGAGMVLTGSLLALISEAWRFPDPFDGALLESEMRNSEQTVSAHVPAQGHGVV